MNKLELIKKDLEEGADYNFDNWNKGDLQMLEEIVIATENVVKKLSIPVVGWRSELLPDFDVKEINEIVKDCKEKKEDLQDLICRIWNKGYMTAVADEREG